MREGVYKHRVFKTQLKLRDQQLKTIMFIYRCYTKAYGNHKPKIYKR